MHQAKLLDSIPRVQKDQISLIMILLIDMCSTSLRIVNFAESVATLLHGLVTKVLECCLVTLVSSSPDLHVSLW